VIRGGKHLLDAKFCASSLKELRRELRAVVGQQRDGRPIQKDPLVAEGLSDCHGSSDAHLDGPRQLRVAVCDHEQEPVPVSGLRQRAQDVYRN
jgi:hypothetical protein